jgi:hypothetical protein
MYISAETIINSTLINKADLARRLWPDNKNPDIKLANKIAKRSGQRITEKDEQEIIDIFKEEFGL